MRTEAILQPEQVYVGAQRHLPHAVRVEVELIFDDFREVLNHD